MSFDRQSPSDMLDLADEVATTCQFCDEIIDEIDVNVEAFELAGCPCCIDCAVAVYGTLPGGEA